jgi:hexosaminidase
VAPPLFAGTDVGFSSLCVSKEVVYQFVDDVIRELAAVSPSPYIHIGGDEALSTTLVDYVTFMEHVMPIVANYGKRVMGWNEITKAETVGDLVAQYWATGTSDFSIAAAVQRGGKVLMSPANKAYLDMKYDESTAYGLTWAGLIEVRTAYDWDPGAHLAGVTETAVLGVEAPLWSETVNRIEQVEFMTFPRLPALAEVAWSPQSAREWNDFRQPWQPTAPAGRRWASPSAAHPRFPGRSTPTWRWAGREGVQHRGCAVARVGHGGRQPHHPLVFRLLRPAVDFD